MQNISDPQVFLGMVACVQMVDTGSFFIYVSGLGAKLTQEPSPMCLLSVFQTLDDITAHDIVSSMAMLNLFNSHDENRRDSLVSRPSLLPVCYYSWGRSTQH